MNKFTRLEMGILFFLGLYLMFTSINVNPTLGQIYLGFITLSLIYVMVDPSRSIPFKKSNDSTLGAIVKGAGAYVVLILVGNYLIVPGVNAVRKLISSTTPALATNPVLNSFNFGGVIPYVETFFFFAVSLDFLASIFGVKISKKNLKSLSLWLIMFGLALSFMIFHATSKGLGNFDQLSLVFFMGLISLILVVWDESYSSAIAFHVIANTLALIG